jgi:hypothetical protein
MVVVVARKDLWKKRVQSNVVFFKTAVRGEITSRLFKICPQLSKNCSCPLFDLWEFWVLKFLVFQTIGIFKPIYRQARRSDMPVVQKCCISRTELHDQYGT